MRTTRTVLVATTTMLALTAVQQASAAPDAPEAATARAASAIRLTNADDGRTIPGKVGDSVSVRLTPVMENGVKWVFTKPTASDADVAAQKSGAEASNGGASASFDLVAAGEVVVQAERRCVVITPGNACPQAIIPWKATLNVA